MYSHEDISRLITDTLGTQDAQVVLDAVNVELEKSKVPPMPDEGRTWGDWAFTVPYLKEELRPFTALSYQNIDLMLRTGIVRFAVDLKRAKMVSSFRNERSLQVISPDRELAKAGLASLTPLLPQLMNELSWSALVYGSAFIETIWGTRTGYQLGIDERRTSDLWSVPVGFNMVPHKTVRAILREPGGRFNGFVQNPALATHYYPADQRTAGLITTSFNDIIVGPDAALVVPYNGFSRKLWGESFLGPIYPLWFWYEIIMRCLVSYTQLMGDPPRLGKAPSKKKLQVTTTGKVIDAVDYIMAVGVNLSKTNTAVIPSDVDPETKVPQYELAYMTVPERSQPFVQILEHINQQILRAALSADKSQISSPGGGAAIGEIHAEATALHDEMVVSSWLYYLNRYFINYLSIFNRGMEGPPVRLEIQGLDPREQALLQSVMGVAGNTKSFDDFFYSVDWRSLGNLAGLPMLTDEEKAELKQKLQEEGLQNQMDQQNVAAQDPALQQKQEMNKKLEALVSKPPMVLSAEEMAHFKVEEPPKVYQINAPLNKRKQVAAVVASLLLEEGVSDEDNPFSSIQLFNPNHDALGRFASKTTVGATKAKEFINKHKRALIAGGTILAAAGIGYVAYKQYQGDQILDTIHYKTSNTGVISKAQGNLSQELIDTINAHTAIGDTTLRDLGVRPQATTIRWHETNESFATTQEHLNYKAYVANQKDWGRTPVDKETYLREMFDSDSLPLAFAGGKEVHFSPEAVENILYSPSDVKLHAGLVAHELFHTRKASSSNRMYEEGMATIFEHATASRTSSTRSGPLSIKDINRTFWNNFSHDDYDDYAYSPRNAKRLMRAAAYKYRFNKQWYGAKSKYKDMGDILVEWANNSNPISRSSDLDKWEKKANEARASRGVRPIGLETEESVQLFNQFHDSLGRFASKTGSAVRGFVKKHKTALTVGGVAVAAIGTATLIAYSKQGTTTSTSSAPSPMLLNSINIDVGEPTVTALEAARALWTKQAGGTLDELRDAALVDAISALQRGAKDTVVVARSLHGIEGVMVTRENRLVGITDKDGNLATTQYVEWLMSAPKNGNRDTNSIKGAGTILMQEAAKKAGGKAITLNSSEQAVEFYKKLGFKTVLTSVYPRTMILGNKYVPAFANRVIALEELHVEDEPGVMAVSEIYAAQSIKLYNSYHDELGRFASKTAFFTGRGKMSAGKIAQVRDSINKEYGPLVKTQTLTCSDGSCFKKHTGSSNPNILGAYVGNKLVLRPDASNRVIAHELIHSRIRSRGPIQLRSPMHRQVEEGTTELLTFRKEKANWRDTPYAKDMMVVAGAARKYSGGDPKKAWHFIDRVHYHNDTDVGVSAIAKYRNGTNVADIEWLLSNRSVKLETAEEFKASEEAIYADIRKVGNEKVNLNVPLPEDF